MYYFIVNPNAGWGKGGRVWQVLSGYLEKHQVEYEAYLTIGKGDAREAARRLTCGRREELVLVGVGGDGTMNEILDGLCFGCPMTLGHIPAGTGNDLGRSLRLPLSPLKGLKHLLRPKRWKLIDYGVLSYGEQEMGHRRFLVSAGIGFDGAVCQAMVESAPSQGRLPFWPRRLSYIKAALCQLLRCRPCKGYILLDGVKKVEFNHIVFISCHIQPYEGGGLKLAPGADGSDGRLAVCVASHSSRSRLLSVFASAFLGRGRAVKGIRRYECGEVQIHTERPLPVHADGESCGQQAGLQVACVPRKIRVVC